MLTAGSISLLLSAMQCSLRQGDAGHCDADAWLSGRSKCITLSVVRVADHLWYTVTCLVLSLLASKSKTHENHHYA